MITAEPTSNEKEPFSVERFARFWAAPDLTRITPDRLPITPDIVVRWPRAGELHGAEAYARAMMAFLRFLPDFRAEVDGHATNGEYTFIRWIARATVPVGPSTFTGVDRFRLVNGLVAENLIHSDHPVFEHLAQSRALG